MAHFHRVTHHVQGHHRDDGLVGVDDLEVDVRDGAAHGVALDLTGHDDELLAIGVEVDQGVESLLARDRRAKALGIDRHWQRC